MLTFFIHLAEEPRKALYLRLVVLFWLLAFSVLVWIYWPAWRWESWHPYRQVVAVGSTSLSVLWIFMPWLRGWVRWSGSENIVLLFSSVIICLAGIQLFMTTDFSRRQVLGAWPNYSVIPELIINFNNVGMRDIHHELDKPAGMLRVVLLGDSFTVGQGVSEAVYYPGLLREMAPENVEFIVVANQGWSTWDQVYAYRSIGRCFSPDLVVVGVVTNDLEPPRPDTLANLATLDTRPSPETPTPFPAGDDTLTEEPSQTHEPAAPTASTVRSQDQWVVFAAILPMDISYLMDYTLNQIAGMLKLRQDYRRYEADLYLEETPTPFPDSETTAGEANRVEPPGTTNSDSEPLKAAPDPVSLSPEAYWREGVNLLHSAITEDGAQGFAFILPSPRRYSESALYQTTLVQHQTLASGFEEAGFSAFDLFPEYLVRFGQHPYRSLWALPNDGHPGEELHSYYADAIWDAIAPILERMPMSDVPIPSPCDTLP